MKTLVLGGGIVGITTAYWLATDGHEVTVVEANDGVGREATASNAGIIAPGHSSAWASPLTERRTKRKSAPLWRAYSASNAAASPPAYASISCSSVAGMPSYSKGRA